MLKRTILLCLIPFLLFYSVPVSAMVKEERSWQDDTIYFLMVDRFNNGNSENDFDVNLKNPLGFQGGDFQGIIDRLDYLKDMGFTAIRLTPIFDNDNQGYAGYRIKNFYNTEEHFGSIKKFKELVKEAHKRDMKVMIDFVTNQVSPENKMLKDVDKKEWFQGETKDNVPAFNKQNPDANQYLIDAAKWWVEQTDIDGYTLNDADQSPIGFWNDFTRAVKSAKSDLYLLADIDSKDPNVIKKYEQAGFDGFLDVPLNQPLRDAFSNINQSDKALLDTWENNKKTFKNPALIGAFFDNQDMIRYTRDMVEANQFPGTRWKLALTYLYTQPEIPVVYYGSEIAVDGGKVPENRKMMNFRTEKELIDHITMIGKIRQKNPALTRGSMEPIYEKDGMMVFKREYKGDINVVAINNTDKTQGVTIPADKLGENKELRGLISGGIVRPDGGEYKLVLERETSDIYKLIDKTGINYFYFSIIGLVVILFFVFIILAKKRGAHNNK